MPHTVQVDNISPEPTGPGIPGPTSDSYDPPIHLDTGITWMEAAKLSSSDLDLYGSNYKLVSKKDKSRGRKKNKGKQPAKQAVPEKPLPAGHVHLRVIPGCNRVQSPIFWMWFNPVTLKLHPEQKNQMGGMLGQHVYWSNHSNTIYAGEMAHNASHTEVSGHDFEVDPK
ncbi:hypothetical protein P691DRAFT_768837 [Macrolepiota fuliginosa MF-IS2]|uniref:Uncharacterized protein n=1 Tax=Macrolepiota fuliginosa MF-IS2 TaxID=1400762 RepID=A0A9P6BVR1_9AGAR|nr:hypothetical protein P691DRAFT_768837 [Macrolepiota fuliginosa MF-IS2]